MASAENIAWLRRLGQTALFDWREQERAGNLFAGPLADRRTGGRCATGSRPRSARARWERDVPFGAFGRRQAEGTGDAHALLRAHRDRPGEPATTHGAGAKADRRRRRASDRTPARPQLTRRRALCDPFRRRPNLPRLASNSNGRGAPNGTTGRVTGKRLRAAHQSAQLELRGAVKQTYIQLSEAEAAARINKSELSIRPIWHQREDRVLAPSSRDASACLPPHNEACISTCWA